MELSMSTTQFLGPVAILLATPDVKANVINSTRKVSSWSILKLRSGTGVWNQEFDTMMLEVTLVGKKFQSLCEVDFANEWHASMPNE